MNDYKPIRICNIYNEEFGTGMAGNVWDADSISPALMTMQGGNRQPMIMVNNYENDSESLEWNRGDEK